MTSREVHLTDPKINMYNQQIIQLMHSIHEELKLIIEDELFNKIGDSMGVVSKIIQMIAKIDIILSFAQYLRSLPNGVQICRPQILK